MLQWSRRLNRAQRKTSSLKIQFTEQQPKHEAKICSGEYGSAMTPARCHLREGGLCRDNNARVLPRQMTAVNAEKPQPGVRRPRYKFSVSTSVPGVVCPNAFIIHEEEIHFGALETSVGRGAFPCRKHDGYGVGDNFHCGQREASFDEEKIRFVQPCTSMHECQGGEGGKGSSAR
jgi:hypothetical protein